MPSLITPPHLLDTQRWKNLRIGLLGGSFDPPHHGHLHISHAALKGLKLDYVWWLVTPQNPNKTRKPIPMQERIDQCQVLATHPQMLVSGLEDDLNTRITYKSVKGLKRHFPHSQFVWISGMDNALGLHRWHNWRDLLGELSFVHLTRNPARSLVQSCPLRLYSNQTHRIIDKSGLWPLDAGTTYWMMQKKMIPISSTEIRNKNQSLKQSKK